MLGPSDISPSAFPILKELLFEAGVTSRWEGRVIEWLGYTGDPRTLDEIRSYLEAGWPSAIAAVGTLRDLRAIPTLERLVRSSVVTHASAEALLAIGFEHCSDETLVRICALEDSSSTTSEKVWGHFADRGYVEVESRQVTASSAHLRETARKELQHRGVGTAGAGGN
jgi:hypothetical protein